MSTIEQVVNKGFKYVTDLNIAWGSNTTLTVAAGQCRDSANNVDMTLSSGVTINFAVNGANGLDTGSIGASGWYTIYLIYSATKSAPTAAIASLSATAPVLPSGYDSIRVIGKWATDGSSHLILGYVAGNGNLRQHYHDTMISVLSGGTATTLTAVDLSAAVPPIENTPVLLEASYTPATANDKVSFAPAGSTATVLPNISSVVAAKAQTGQLKVLSKIASSKAELLYINSAGSGSASAWVSGFEYFI